MISAASLVQRRVSTATEERKSDGMDLREMMTYRRCNPAQYMLRAPHPVQLHFPQHTIQTATFAVLHKYTDQSIVIR